tara:strand:+ start:58 stop:321 length:264 start_codon:yes stop_codon:yes gene_type:complete
MTQEQLIELVKLHHPDMPDTLIRIYLNKALDDFCRKTRVLKGYKSVSSVANQRYYDLDSSIIEVTRVDIDNYEIPRIVGKPEFEDVN